MMEDSHNYLRRSAPHQRIVSRTGRSLLEEGNSSRTDSCRMFRGDLYSLVVAATGILSKQREDPVDSNSLFTLPEAAESLRAQGLEVRVQQADSLEDLAIAITDGAAAFLAVNAGELLQNPAFFDSGHPNQLVMPVFCYRDVESLQMAGFTLHYPSADVSEAPIFVPCELLARAWLEAEGRMLVATNLEFFENLS